MDELNEQVAPEQVDEPQYSEVELKAMELGWRPKKEFSGDETEFVDAKEFVARQPLFDKIEQLAKKVKAQERSLNSFQEHYTKVEQAAFERAIKQLKVQQKEALRDGDIDKFYEINEQIEENQEKVKIAKASPQNQDPHPEFVSWVNKNPWYEKSDSMRAYADKVGTRLHQSGLAPEEVLAEVEKSVKKEFPERFTNPRKADPSAVENSNGSRRSKSTEDFSLTEQERKIMNDLVRAGHMTKEQYIADLKKVKER